jgi:predicted dehydrogenase
MSALSVLVVGCGNMAGGFDAGRRGTDAPPLTHAGAYRRDGRFMLAACVEPDDARRRAFMQDWHVPAGFRSIQEASGRYDVVSICSPTAAHAADLEAALTLGPRAVFCEKPVTESAARTRDYVERCKASGIAFAVNYTRRWDASVQALQKEIREGRRGPLRSAVGYYNKGLLNNGSHMLDLLLLLLGPLRVVKSGRPVADYAPHDPSMPVWLETESGIPVLLACGHAQDYALFELELVFASAVVRMEEGGLYWRERSVENSTTFAGFRVPGEGVRRGGAYPEAMLRSVGNIFGAIHHGEALASTGESALAAQRLCEEIRQS